MNKQMNFYGHGCFNSSDNYICHCNEFLHNLMSYKRYILANLSQLLSPNSLWTLIRIVIWDLRGTNTGSRGLITVFIT